MARKVGRCQVDDLGDKGREEAIPEAFLDTETKRNPWGFDWRERGRWN